jgi:hypothetical protein
MKKFILVLLVPVILIGGLLFLIREDEETAEPAGITRSPREEAELRAILDAATLETIPSAARLREARVLEDFEQNKSGLIRLNLIAENIQDYMNYSAAGLSEGLRAVQNERNKWGFADREGQAVISHIYDSAGNFSGGLAAVAIYDGRKMGYINKNGEIVIELIYDIAGDFNGGYAVVAQRNRNIHNFGVIDTAGNIAVPLEYNSIAHANHEDWFIAEKADDNQEYWYGVIDSGNNIILPFEYGAIYPFYNGLAMFRSRNSAHYGFMNTRGETVIPEAYDSPFNSQTPFYNSDAAFVRRDDKYALINKSGGLITDFIFVISDNFSEGMAMVIISDDPGVHYVDEAGNIIIRDALGENSAVPPGYNFQDGVAVVMSVENDTAYSGLIDKTGKFVLPQIYRHIINLGEGLIAAMGYSDSGWNIYEIEEIR